MVLWLLAVWLAAAELGLSLGQSPGEGAGRVGGRLPACSGVIVIGILTERETTSTSGGLAPTQMDVDSLATRDAMELSVTRFS